MKSEFPGVRSAFVHSTKLIVKPAEISQIQNTGTCGRGDGRSKQNKGYRPYIKIKNYRRLSQKSASVEPKFGVTSLQNWRDYQKSLKHIGRDKNNANCDNSQCAEMESKTSDDTMKIERCRKNSCWMKCELQVYVCVYSTGATCVTDCELC